MLDSQLVRIFKYCEPDITCILDSIEHFSFYKKAITLMDFVNYDFVSYYYYLTKEECNCDIIEELKFNIDWTFLSCYCKFDLEFLEKFNDFLNLDDCYKLNSYLSKEVIDVVEKYLSVLFIRSI